MNTKLQQILPIRNGAEAKDLAEKFCQLDKFPGNIQEYTLLKREQGLLLDCDIIVPMDTGFPNKSVWYEARTLEDAIAKATKGAFFRGTQYPPDFTDVIKFFTDNVYGKLCKMLLENGCIGLVHHQYVVERFYTGLPVKIRERPVHPFR